MDEVVRGGTSLDAIEVTMMEWKTVSEGNFLWGTEVTRVTVENE